MRDRLRSALALALLCGLAVGLAACGGGEGDEETSGSSSTVAATDISGTLTVWDIISGFTPAYTPVNNKLIEEFEREYPNVTVNVVDQPYEGYQEVYQAAFAAKQGPDVMNMVSGPLGVLRYEAGLEVLNDRIPAELDKNITNWNSATAGLAEEGDRYGVPVGAGGNIFYYNKELFEKAGLPREFQPKTWDELKATAEKLKAAGIEPFAGGDKEGYESGWWFSFGWQTENTPEQAIEMAEGELPMTDEAVAKAIGPELMMQEAGLFPKDRYTTPYFPNGGAAFGEGKGAIGVGYKAMLDYYKEYNEALGEKNVGMFLPPGSNFLNGEAEWVWSIPKFSGNKDAAWAFIEFMSSAHAAKAYFNGFDILPNRKDVSLPADATPQAKQLQEWGKELGLFPSAVVTVPVPEETFFTEMLEVMQGRKSLAAAQESMQETAERDQR